MNCKCIYGVLTHWIKSLKYERQKKFMALYGFFRENEATGEIEGQIERSFDLAWMKDQVAPMPLELAQDHLKGYLPGGKDHVKGYRYFIYRISRKSANALITCDWKTRRDKLIVKWETYVYRNVNFVLNGRGQMYSPQKVVPETANSQWEEDVRTWGLQSLSERLGDDRLKV